MAHPARPPITVPHALLPGEAAGRAEPEARKQAAEILAVGVGTVLALRLGPDCIPALADPSAVVCRRDS